jgi:hypothetical protein
MVYFFYLKNDKNEEPIMCIDNVNTKEGAIRYFSIIKKMSSDIFLRLFSVGRYKKRVKKIKNSN